MANVKIPSFSYTGTEPEKSSDGTYWYLCFKSNCTITMNYKKNVDVFLIGGGAGGRSGGLNGTEGGGNGGGGGAVVSSTAVLSRSTTYTISIGNGGASDTNGGDTTITGIGVNLVASGGKTNGESGGGLNTSGKGGNGGATNQNATAGGNGVSLTIGGIYSAIYGAAGGGGGYASIKYGVHQYGTGGTTGGGNGGQAYGSGEYGNAEAGKAADFYGAAGGGGGGWQVNADGSISGQPGGDGHAGMIVIRGTENDELPIRFNGNAVHKAIYRTNAGDVEIHHISFNGNTIF